MNASQSKCPLCHAVAAGTNHPRFLFEFNECLVLAGEHQYFPGYCVVVSKTHQREMHDLPNSAQVAILQCMMKVGKAINESFRPLKLNYASLGNIEEHLHWHIIPRYTSEPDPKTHPWAAAEQFCNHATQAEDVHKLRLCLKDLK